MYHRTWVWRRNKQWKPGMVHVRKRDLETSHRVAREVSEWVTFEEKSEGMMKEEASGKQKEHCGWKEQQLQTWGGGEPRGEAAKEGWRTPQWRRSWLGRVSNGSGAASRGTRRLLALIQSEVETSTGLWAGDLGLSNLLGEIKPHCRVANGLETGPGCKQWG